MAKFICLSLMLVSFVAHAQIFQNPFSQKNEKRNDTGPSLEKSLTELDNLEVGAGFEESYRSITLEIERQLDLKRGDCGENPNNKNDKQRCFRTVVSAQKRYLERGFKLKKEYLNKLHERQISALDEAKAKALKDLERQF